MNSYDKVKQMIAEYMQEDFLLSYSEFAEKVNRLFAGTSEVNLDSELVGRLVRDGEISAQNDLVPSRELTKICPLTYIDLQGFAIEAKISRDQVTSMIEDGEIKTIYLGCPMISRLELRRYWREHDMQVIYSMEDLLKMLDHSFRDTATWWNNFFSDRNKRIPFFVELPDENLVSYIEINQLKPHKVLELGCGNGRNAVYLSQQGCEVDAVDISEEALRWAKDIADKKQVQVNFLNESIYDLQISTNTYDFIYDAGCFHHVLPHRRFTYKELVKRALKPDGYLGMTCFTHEINPGFSDWEIYEYKWAGGGMAFSRIQLEEIFGDIFEIVEFRRMKDIKQPAGVFGIPYLWTVLFKKKSN